MAAASRAQSPYGRARSSLPERSSRRVTIQSFQTASSSTTVVGRVKSSPSGRSSFFPSTDLYGGLGFASTTSSKVLIAVLPTLPPDLSTYSQKASR